MGYLIEAAYLGAVCVLSHLLHHRCGVSAAVTRKLTHILVGFIFFIQYHFFAGDALGMLLLPSLITLGLFLVARFRLVDSMVNPENPYGIFAYALAILVSNIVCLFYPACYAAAGAAILSLSLGDGAAALLTRPLRHRHRIYGEKTLEGSLLCFFFALVGIILLGTVFPALRLAPALVLLGAAAATLLELSAGKLDNPAIVLGVGAFLVLLGMGDTALHARLLVGMAVGLCLVVLSVAKRLLSLPAALTALLMLLIILAFGGYFAALYMLLHFLLAALLQLTRRKRKKKGAHTPRGILQVLANGGAPTLALLLYGTTGAPAFLVAYLASVAEFLADTAASDLGTLFPGEPVDICRLTRVPRGQSGGVSLPGTLSAAGAALLSLLLALVAFSPRYAVTVALAAFLGMLADSLLGSLAQGKFRCRVCGAYTERRTHCEALAERTGGLALLTNSGVNLLSSLLAAALAATLSLI